MPLTCEEHKLYWGPVSSSQLAYTWIGERPAMSVFRVACQTITWGQDQSRRFPEVFAAVAAAGYQGVEIGFRHLAGLDAGTLRHMLANGTVGGAHLAKSCRQSSATCATPQRRGQ